MRALALLPILLATALLSGPVCSHEARPIYIEIREATPGMFAVRGTIPATLAASDLPTIVLPDHCTSAVEPRPALRGDAWLISARHQCEGGLSGHELRLSFPSVNPSMTTLWRVHLASGESHSQVLRPGVTHWRLPLEEQPFGVAAEYTGLGIEHIWTGVDHLLFVACLIFVAGSARRIVVTITGFTVAHSLTLALSTLQLVQLSTAPVEAVIALSIVFMAVEIHRDDPASWTLRYPMAIASCFGLLHGFGFASVLREIGLPQTELPLALLSFNVGVEVGQLAFIALAAAAMLMVRSVSTSLASTLVGTGVARVSVAYLVGSISCYWLIDRVAGFWWA